MASGCQEKSSPIDRKKSNKKYPCVFRRNWPRVPIEIGHRFRGVETRPVDRSEATLVLVLIFSQHVFSFQVIYFFF
ncbi:hypothetical protein DS62_06575, partial [Smithella sp. SC_K08D17]|jgi:hypothetical protein